MIHSAVITVHSCGAASAQPVGRRRPAFTLVEILTIISIITMLVAIMLPTLSKIRIRAREGASLAVIRLIEGACNFYYDDFNEYPPSRRVTIGSTVWQGRNRLVQALTGYCPDIGEDGEPSGVPQNSGLQYDDGASRYGFRMVRRGKVYGPYNGAENVKTVLSPQTDAGPPAKGLPCFIDAFANPVYYYRFEGRVPDDDVPYEPGFASPKYHNADNVDDTGEPNGPNWGQNKMINYYAQNKDDGSGIPFLKTFILLTAGADGEWKAFADPNEGNETDDITNFLPE